MFNKSKKKVVMPVQNPDVRKDNFEEVALGYTLEMAKEEAFRCLNCKHTPCKSGCPVGVNIPEFINAVKNSDIELAYKIISETNALPAICGRVCPQEKQCEKKCVRAKNGEPVGIGNLERFVADWYMENMNESINVSEKSNGIKVAVVGSGPSGLTCANDLSNLGYDVTIYEALHCAGGVLSYGIPEFRLPKDIVNNEINKLKSNGVKIVANVIIGKTIYLDELFEMGYKAIYIASGAGTPKFMGIPGEGLPGVYSANEFLTRINLMHAYLEDYDTPIEKLKKVIVVGGGNVAMDAARCARRLGADVNVMYRRSEIEMPARKDEINHAKEEGINFLFLSNPIEIIGNSNTGNVEKVKYIKMKLSEPDASGRCKPVPTNEEPCLIDSDCVIIAIGNSPNAVVTNSDKSINCDSRGCIVVNDSTLATSKENVYAGGDIVTGAATVILAMGAGKKAALQIHNDICKNKSDAL